MALMPPSDNGVPARSDDGASARSCTVRYRTVRRSVEESCAGRGSHLSRVQSVGERPITGRVAHADCIALNRRFSVCQYLPDLRWIPTQRCPEESDPHVTLDGLIYQLSSRQVSTKALVIAFCAIISIVSPLRAVALGRELWLDEWRVESGRSTISAHKRLS